MTSAAQKMVDLLLFNDRDPEKLEAEIILILEEEKSQVVDAWIAGNAAGWAQTTDWPEDGKKYFDEKYKK